MALHKTKRPQMSIGFCIEVHCNWGVIDMALLFDPGVLPEENQAGHFDLVHMLGELI